jgi:Family of unknown function (DUF6518)
MLARLRAMDPRRADLLLGAVFLVEAIVELIVLVPSNTEHEWAIVLIVTGLAGAIAIRRRSPVAAVVAAVPLFIAANALGTDYVDHMVSPFFAVLLLSTASAGTSRGASCGS